jgi:hypothetical protein
MNEKREYHKKSHYWRIEWAATAEERKKEGYNKEDK